MYIHPVQAWVLAGFWAKILLNGGSGKFTTGELSRPSSTETAISITVLPRTHAHHTRKNKGRTPRQAKKNIKNKI